MEFGDRVVGEEFLLEERMTTAGVVDLFRGAFMTTFWLSLPVLAVGFVIGIVMSLIQIVTSIQDSSFSTVPRLTAFLVALVVAMPWMLARLIAYTIGLWGNFGRFAH
jgi:flagellar biosynthesis protein FliQ